MNLHLTCNHCGVEIRTNTFHPAPELTCPICGTINQTPPQRLERGAILAGYRILRRIEADRASEIYLARAINQRLLIHLQTFKSVLFENGAMADYYLAGMKQWMQVRQPNIIKVVEAGRSSTGIFFAASVPAKGITLEDRLWKGGAVELKPAIHLAISISQILEWLWKEHGLIYGQLNPRNIILTPDKNILLSHMALAPVLKTRPPGLFIGEFATSTPGFTCPEQFSSLDTLDFRGDMYSLGATLYHMLTGKPPFACLNAGEVITQHRAPSLADPRMLRPDLPDEFVWLLEILLAHDPKDRFDSWESLIKILASLDYYKGVLQQPALKSHSVLIRLPPSDLAKLPRRPNPKQIHPLYPGPSTAGKRDSFGILISVALILSALLIILFVVTAQQTDIPPPKRETQIKLPSARVPLNLAPLPSDTRAVPDTPPPFRESSQFMSLLVETRKFARQNPLQYEEILKRYQMLIAMAETNAPRWVTGLQEQVHAIDLAMAGPLDDAEQAIRLRVRQFEDEGQYQAGIDWLEHYSGPFLGKTKPLRQAMTNLLKAQASTSKSP